MLKKIADFSIEYMQVLDENGVADAKLDPKLDNDLLKKMFELMLFTKLFDDKCISLQRQGRMFTFAPCRGQEASEVASALALEKNDWLFPTYRESAALIARGIPLYDILLYWKGSEDGNKKPAEMNCFPISIPIASQIQIATGTAWASKLKKEKNASLVYFGDGATSEGDFHDGLNFAGVFKAPVVFFCQNNHYAISVHCSKQTASQTIAQKAIAYGIRGVQVDGNDALAVYKTVKEALDRARKGEGPTLIEALTYRTSMHTTADDPTKYMEEKELKEWIARDPIERFRKYLTKKKIWSKEWEEKIVQKITGELEQAIKQVETHQPKPEDLFTNVFEKMPANLQEQMQAAKEAAKEAATQNG